MPYLANETPPFLATTMAEIAGIRKGTTVLEPSAGMGNLAYAAKIKGAKVHCVELNANCATNLKEQGCEVFRSDFLQMRPNPAYKVVLMNPPMSAVSHLIHALGFLTPDGVLVALVHATVWGSEHFCAEMLKLNIEWKPLPDDMFEFNGHPISCGILVARK